MPDEQLIFEFVDGSRELIRKGTWRYWELIEDGHTPVGSVPASDGISDALESYLAARFTAGVDTTDAAVDAALQPGKPAAETLSATFVAFTDVNGNPLPPGQIVQIRLSADLTQIDDIVVVEA